MTGGDRFRAPATQEGREVLGDSPGGDRDGHGIGDRLHQPSSSPPPRAERGCVETSRGGMPPTARFDATPLGPRWWGTARLVEAIAYPVDVPVTARRITQNLSPFLCRWCAEAIATRHCPFCGMDAARTALVGGAA